MSSLSIPAAIVAGSLLLSIATGLGLYFGLRGRPTPIATSPADSTQSIATLTGATSRAGPRVAETVPKATVASSAVIGETAKEAVLAQHAHLVDKCWSPSVARKPLPAQVTYTLALEYEEDGHLALHSLKPAVPGARPDVTSCVYDALVIPVVPSPGRKMVVNVPITLP